MQRLDRAGLVPLRLPSGSWSPAAATATAATPDAPFTDDVTEPDMGGFRLTLSFSIQSTGRGDIAAA